jgi:MFS family permease
MPQAIAALATKFLLPFILARFGYRMVLIGNTVMLGLLMTAFALIGPDTSVWAIVALGACNGIVQSLQYTSMNTLVYSDIPQSRASNASSLSGALQQLSISFGIAAAGLTTVLFVPQSVRSNPAEFLHGIHEAFVALGTFTVLSSVLFWRLRSQDGGAVSLKREVRIGGQGA